MFEKGRSRIEAGQEKVVRYMRDHMFVQNRLRMEARQAAIKQFLRDNGPATVVEIRVNTCQDNSPRELTFGMRALVRCVTVGSVHRMQIRPDREEMVGPSGGPVSENQWFKQSQEYPETIYFVTDERGPGTPPDPSVDRPIDSNISVAAGISGGEL